MVTGVLLRHRRPVHGVGSRHYVIVPTNDTGKSSSLVRLPTPANITLWWKAVDYPRLLGSWLIHPFGRATTSPQRDPYTRRCVAHEAAAQELCHPNNINHDARPTGLRGCWMSSLWIMLQAMVILFYGLSFMALAATWGSRRTRCWYPQLKKVK
jgi:hypothetical protein